MELTSEDELRLQVLLVNAEAIRIDEQRGVVFGLAGSSELQAVLTPSSQSDRYLAAVRQYLSTIVLGSPRHFPSHLRRWAGMGQMQNAPLEKLLLLGDPEAAYAVACSQSLTPDLARKVWWVAPGAETARVLLRNSSVVSSALGATLAAWLAEYLPFETHPNDILESTRLLLQTNLVDEGMRRRLWDRGQREKAFRVGFLLQVPQNLPLIAPTLSNAAEIAAQCRPMEAKGFRLAAHLIKNTSSSSQSFLAAVSDILVAVKHQDEVTMTLRAVSHHYGSLHEEVVSSRTAEQIQSWMNGEPGAGQLSVEMQRFLLVAPGLAPQARALATLAQVDEQLVASIFARSSAGGSVMRRQLQPIFQVIDRAIAVLRGQ